MIPILLTSAWPLAMALVLVSTVPGQIPVRFGEPVRSGTIANPLQIDRYVLIGAQQGDVLRVSFGCNGRNTSSGYYYHHRIDIWDGTTSIGNIQGNGVLTAALPTTGFYTIEIRARNNQDTGWYAFQVDRLNDPAGAERIAFNWNMRGTIPSAAGFDVYTLRAVAGSSGILRFTSTGRNTSSGWYYHHYAEVVDQAGTRIAVVSGDGSAPVSFPADGLYTVFVAARNLQDTGWYAASVDCQSWPGIPCDTVAHHSNYGQGWPGTLGVPTLTAAAPPVLGAAALLDVGNSYGQQTTAFLLISVSPENTIFPAYGGTLLAQPSVVLLLTLPPAGLRLTLPLPNDPFLSGLGFATQSLVFDPGAQPGQIAFSRGLLLVLGR